MLAFEIGAFEAVLTGEAVRVAFSCEPTSLIDALRRGSPPERLIAGRFDVIVQP